MTEDWWILGRDRTPIGPVNKGLMLQGILAGRVPADALVCEVGGTAWQSIREVGQFATAFAKLRIDGPTLVDPPETTRSLDTDEPTRTNLMRFDDVGEHTIADAVPLPSDPHRLRRFEDVTEATVVDEPLLPSDPPR